ncbi:MAG: SIMPL domain-containing protein [Nitrososphaera sp.]|nr:SIMPL domain-containing protein [Nitrososphaera sp.]
MSDQKINDKRKLALIAGMLAIGMVAASIVGGQMLSAAAQQNTTDPMPVDIGCPTGAETCEDVVKSVVSTSGTATVKVDPDKVTVNIGVETDGMTAEEAATKNAELMEKVLAALKELGIADDQISTSWYSVYPIYEYRSPPCIEIYPQPPDCAPKSEITGYRASNSLSVTLDASEDIGKVIDAAVAAGANQVSGVYFFVSDERQQEIRDSLIEKSIANARSRADKAANAVSMEISGVRSIHLNDVYFPVFYKDFAAEASGASTPILPGEQQITMTVQVTYFMS